MGYRIDINDGVNSYYGTKLYGYVKDEKEFESYRYLIEIGKFNGYEVFDYGCDNEITLNPEQFRKFIELYLEDLKKYDNSTLAWSIEEIDELTFLYKSERDKAIDWG